MNTLHILYCTTYILRDTPVTSARRIASVSRLSVSTVYKHLRILRDAGIVSNHDGKWFYVANNALAQSMAMAHGQMKMEIQ